MIKEVPTLQSLLNLEQRDDGLFEAPASHDGPARVFGGQVIAQALAAAMRTVKGGRPCHSVHAHFLRPADGANPMQFAVEPLRDGRNFSTRRVTMSQHGRPALVATVSCHSPEIGLEYSPQMPDAPPPEGLRTEQQVRADELAIGHDTRWVRSPLFPKMHFDLRPVHPRRFAKPEKRPPHQLFWFRLDEPAPTDTTMAQVMLAYMTDMMLLSTTLLPHGIFWTTTAMQEASLDHTVWFHAPPKLDEWMLWDLNVEWTGSGRGLARGRIFTSTGDLIASVMQEGLIRISDSESAS